MTDQAEALRRRMMKQGRHQYQGRVLAVVSGKGGVGKSVFCVNFSTALSQLGKKVVIIDLDIGMGNVEFLMGIDSKVHIVDMIKDRIPIWDVITKSSEDVAFISGGSGFLNLFQLNDDDLSYFLSQIKELKEAYDFIIFDFGAGVTNDTLKVIMAVHEIILVTTPEPPALTDAYSMLKMVHSRDSGLPVACVINQTEDEREGRTVWTKLSGVSKRFLDKEVKLLAVLPRDKVVVLSVKEQTPYMLLSPHAKISVKMAQLTRNYLNYQQNHTKPSFTTFLTRLKDFLEKKGDGI